VNSVLRVPFMTEDLLRTKFAAQPAPLLELTLALAVLQHRDALFERWRRRARAALPRAAAPLLELVEPSADCPYFLHPISDDVEDGLATVLATPQPVVDRELARMFAAGRVSSFTRALGSRDREAWAELSRSLRSAHQALLSDHWQRVQAGYQAEVALQAGTFARRGMRAVLTSVYPGTAWDGGTLQIPAASLRSIDLAGRGVTLMPSVLWRGRPLFGGHAAAAAGRGSRHRVAGGPARHHARRDTGAGGGQPDNNRARPPGRSEPFLSVGARQGAAGLRPDHHNTDREVSASCAHQARQPPAYRPGRSCTRRRMGSSSRVPY
jgi:hypothetical protein